MSEGSSVSIRSNTPSSGRPLSSFNVSAKSSPSSLFRLDITSARISCSVGGATAATTLLFPMIGRSLAGMPASCQDRCARSHKASVAIWAQRESISTPNMLRSRISFGMSLMNAASFSYAWFSGSSSPSRSIALGPFPCSHSQASL